MQSAFVTEDLTPKVLGFFCEDEVDLRGVADPRFPAHLVFQLAGAPSCVTGKNLDLVAGRKRFGNFDERFERMPEAQVGNHVRVGNERVRMEVTERGGLNGTANVQRLFSEAIGEIFDQHLSEFVVGGSVEHQSQRPCGIVLAYEDDGAMKERTV